MSDEKRKFISSIIFGIVLSLKIISFSLDNSKITTIGLMVSFILLIIVNFKFKVNFKFILYSSLILVVATFMFFNQKMFGTNEYFKRNWNLFFNYGIIAFLIVQHKYKISTVIDTVILSYLFCGYWFLKKDFGLFITGDLMSVSYTILPLFIALILKYFGLRKKITIKGLVILVLLFPFWRFLLVYCSRGVYLSLLAGFLLCFCLQKITAKKIIIVLIIFIIAIILLANILDILVFMNNFLEQFGISFKIIEKNARLMIEGDISNGREDIYPVAIDGIKNSFFWGYGIGSFNIKYGIYPHNFVLQMLYEGGIVLLIPFIIPVVYGLYSILKKKNISKDMKILIIFLFTISIIRLSISYEFWKEMYFWMYLSVCMLSMFNMDISTENEIKELKE